MEEIMELIKLPFAILDANTSSDGTFGYAILMILIGVWVITSFYYILDFVLNTFKILLKFLGDVFSTFASIFKRPAKIAPIPNIENIVDIAIKSSYSDMSKTLKNMSNSIIDINKKLEDNNKLNDLV